MLRQTKHIVEALKIRRGAESFWVVVLHRDENGVCRVRCDNDTSDPQAPRYGEEFELEEDEEILDSMRGAAVVRVLQ